MCARESFGERHGSAQQEIVGPPNVIVSLGVTTKKESVMGKPTLKACRQEQLCHLPRPIAWGLLMVGLPVLALVACGNDASSTPVIPSTSLPKPTSQPSIGLTSAPASDLTDTPLPKSTLDCPEPPDPTVAIRVDPVVLEVGDTLRVVPSPSGFALARRVSLRVNSLQVADLDWGSGKIDVHDNIPALRVIFTAESERAFTLEAIEPGTVDLRVSAWGDAGFCAVIDGQCSCSTTHSTADSETVSVTVLP
jgi:hypothetical protein